MQYKHIATQYTANTLQNNTNTLPGIIIPYKHKINYHHSLDIVHGSHEISDSFQILTWEWYSSRSGFVKNHPSAPNVHLVVVT